MQAKRGRPKQYDAEKALLAAGEVFWNKGFSATSLDDLAGAMNMNRPSIYRAFGDKEAIYRLALEQFGKQMDDGFRRTILREKDFRNGLRKFYREALDIYTAGEAPLGCMVLCTAPAAAVDHPEIQSDLASVIQHIDNSFIEQIEKAIEQGQLDKNLDARSLTGMLQAIQHSLAIRARAGESRTSLRKFIDTSIALLLGEH